MKGIAERFEDISCVVHLHSTHSDGTGTVAEIAAAARACGVDVVLLTDHDTLAASERGEDGWRGSVLVLVGEEVSPPDQNHYLAFGVDRVIDHRGLSPAEIAAAVRDAGGFGFAAHPFSIGNPALGRAAKAMPFRDLEAVDGIELWNFVGDSGEQFAGWPDALRFLRRPERWMPDLPQRNLDEWDRLGAARRVPMIGGLDAHQKGFRVAGRVPLRLMSYRRSFRMLSTHVLMPSPLSGDLARDRALVFDALRAGRSYIARDWIAPARGFTFTAGPGSVAMGEETTERPPLSVRTPRPAALRLLRDGVPVASADDAAELDYRPAEPGVYRVEARLGGRLWIVSGAIYLR
jgi:hypothetical protein